MKKMYFALLIVATFVVTSCCFLVPKEEPVKLVKEVPKIPTTEYVKWLQGLPEVQSLKSGEMLIKFVPNNLVQTSGIITTVGRFKSNCRYGYLESVLEQTHISAVWVAPQSGTHLEVFSLADLKSNHDWTEKFLVLDTNRIWVEISDTVYYKDGDGKFLRTD